MHSSCILLSCLLLVSIRPLEGQFSGCHSSCTDSRGNSHCYGDQCLAACPVYIEDDDPVLIVEVEGAIHISDEDVNDQFIIQSAVVEIFPKDTADFNDVYLSTENDLLDGVLEIDDSENGVLYIIGEESSVTYQSILNNVTIWIDNKEPDAVDRIICYTVSDGVQPSDPFCITLKIILINDNTPSFLFNATTSAYEEGTDGLNLLQDLVITDVDHPEIFPMQNATIRVSEWCNTTDIITVDTDGTDIAVSGNGSPCITLTGNDTLENYAKVFLTASYSNSADEPVVDYSRSIVFSLFDGTNTGKFNITIDIDYVDDHATEVMISPSVVEVSETDVLQRVLLSDITKLTLMDNDQNNMDVYVNQMSLMIEQALEIEQLNLKDSSVLTNNITVTGDGTSHIQFYGRDLLSNYQEILNNIEYGVNITEVPCQRFRTITITVGESDTLLLEIIPVNDHPPVLVPAQETVSYYRNSNIYPFAGIKITDEDTNCTKDFFYIMKVTFENISGTETVKFYDFPWFSFNSMLCDNDSIASYLSNRLQQYYNNTAPLEYFYCNCNIGSDCQLTVAGVATIEQYQTLLESLVYFNEAIQPLDTERVFMVSVNDSVYEAVAVISIVDLNKPPVLMLGVDTVNTMIAYTDGQVSPIVIAPELGITDEDSKLLIGAKVTLIDGTQDDILNINYSQSLNVTIIDGEIILTVSNGLSVSQFEDVLKSVTYFRNAEIFESPMHEVIFTVTDLEGEESIPAKVMILFEDRPLLDLNGVDQIGVNFTIYYNNVSTIPIVSDVATIIDIDSDMATSLTVTILTSYNGDIFGLPVVPEHNSLVKSEDNGVISYTGVHPISVYIALLKSFTFTNTIEDYSNEDRRISFQVFTHEDDHLNSSNVAGTTIKVNKFTPTFNVVEPIQTTGENLPSGTSVFDLTATDGDIGAAGVITYSLIQANPTEGLDHFTINYTSGMITTLVSLDRENISQYVLTVEAADSGIPPKKSQIHLTVVVGDVNDNSPVFSQDIYYVDVSESAGINEVIATAVATDKDDDDFIFYEGGSTSSFSFNGNDLVVTAPLDAEMDTLYTLTVVAFDSGGNKATAEYVITVLDVNDNEPVFENSSYEASIPENSDGLEVLMVHANDLDISNDSITYSLLTGADNFAIDSTTGQITVIELDKEQASEHTVMVQAGDDGLPEPLSGLTTVRVIVLDINDNDPVFNKSVYEVAISERFPVNETFLQVFATDADSLDSGKLIYSIVYNESELFDIDEITGDISLLSMVDFEGHPTNMSIWVAVNDTDDNMDIAEVKVMIVDSNDVPPYIHVSSDILPFSEGQVELYPFGQVMISDSDTSQILVSAIITLTSPEEGVNANNDCFCSNTNDETSCTIGCQEFIQISTNFPGLVSVLNNSTTILLSGNFTHEVYESAISNITYINILSNPMPNRRHVSVTVNDGISDSNTEIVTIRLDQFPLFERNLYYLKIQENVTLNSTIVQVVAIDSDNSILIYSITDTDDFMIDNNGEITTTAVIDYELVQVYNFTVHVLNQETLNTDYAQINIEILDVDDNPPILTLIPESAVLVELNTITSLASSLQISDADSLPTLTSAALTIISGPGALVNLVTPPNGIVVTGINTLSLTFTGEQSLSVYESLLQSVVYIDYTEEPALVERSILYQVFSNEFSDSNTFNVTVELENDQEPVILLTENSNRFETIFTENSNPVSLSSDISINDGDSGENMISYAIIELIEAPDNDSESLSISLPMGLALDPTSNTKKLIVNGKDSHDAYITALESVKYVNTAEDPSNLTRTVSFVVNDGLFNSEPAITSVVVIPVNDPPVITLESNNTMVTYLEGQSSPLVLAPQLTISDVDSELLLGANIVLLNGSSHEILNISTSSTDGLNVSISSNEISIVSSFGSSLSSFQNILRSVNYFISNEIIPSMREVLFTVTDMERAESVYAKVIILFNEQPVLDLNGLQQPGVDYIVYFNDMEDTIKIVSDVATIIDIDSDMATSLTVTNLTNYNGDIFGLPEHNSLVKSEDNGAISYTGVHPISVYIDLLRSFTFTNTIEYYSNEDRRILFQVFTKHDDLSSASNFAESTIKVNKYTPSFEPIEFETVSENLSSGTSVVNLTATDGDIGAAGIITYSLIQANPTEGLDHFTVNYTSGMITTLVFLDRENISQYVLTVEAADSGIPPKKSQINVTVVVGDVNDNSPVFSQDIYYVDVSESTGINEVIATAVATDKDDDFISYEAGSSSSFSFNGNNLVVTVPLDAEVTTMYTLTVVAYSGGNQTTAEYVITVLDVNDNEPFFENSSYEASIPENSNGLEVIMVHANDLDISNDSISYSLLTGADNFAIDSTTGQITVIELDKEKASEHTVMVQAVDDGLPEPLSGLTTVRVIVLDINDNDPVFNKSVYEVAISERFPVNETFLQVVATDADSLDSGKLIYSIVYNESELFDIDEDTGDISLLSMVDFEGHPTNMSIWVAVNDTDDNMDTTEVKVMIVDSNDVPPYIHVSSDILKFLEGQVGLYPFGQVMISDSDTSQILVSAIITLTSPEEGVNTNNDCFCSNTNNETSCTIGCQEFIQISTNFPGLVSVLNNSTTILLSGNFTHEVYESAISNITYINILSNPMPTRRHVSVTVNDGISDSNTEIVTIRLDQFPLFERNLYNLKIQENVTLNSIIDQVVAIDSDNSILIYSITDTDDFMIDNNGEITTTAVIDYELVQVYNFTVHVLNQETLNTDYAQINIEILDVDDNPPILTFISESAVLVEPNTVTFLANSLQISDADSLPTLTSATLTIVSGPGTLTILVTPPNGIVVTGISTTSLTFTGEQSLSIYESLLQSVVYTDATEEPALVERSILYQVFSNEFSDSDTFNVTVELENDQEPVILLTENSNRFETIFTENSNPVSLSSDLSINDGDSGENSISYAIVELTEAPDGDSESLNITLPMGLALDPTSSTKKLIVNGQDSHDAYITALESVKYVNTAEDPSNLTRTVSFVVNDGLFNSEPAITSVVVIPVNDPPVITLESNNTMVTYLEGQSSPLVLAPQLTISDVDSELLLGANIVLLNGSSHEILNISTSSTDGLNVSISSNEISIVSSFGSSLSSFQDILRSVNYFISNETIPSMREVLFTVTDMEEAESVYAKVMILFNEQPVLDLNGLQQPGVNYTVYFNDVEDTIKIVSDVATIIDIDSDMATSLTVTNLTNYNGDNFGLPEHNSLVKSEDNGAISYTGVQSISVYIDLLRSFTFTNTIEDYSNEDRRILFQVFTKHDDLSSASNFAESTIKVNKYTPSFEPIEVVPVSENLPSGTSVVDLTATDDDIGAAGIITYSLIQANPTEGLDHFIVNYTSGIITTLVSLDRENISQYILSVEAADSGIPPKKSQIDVTVVVGDVNDNSPVFSQDIYYVDVLENAVNGEIIATAVATDKDISDSILYYPSDDSSSSFSVNANGNIMVAASLDAETTTMYTVTVVADDSGGNQATAEYNITVLDVNDNSPVIIFGGNNIVHYIEGMGAASIGAVMLPIVSDADSNELFHMTEALVELVNHMDGTEEYLNVNGTNVPQNITYEVSKHTIRFIGEASVSDYQQALRAVTYQNSALEPLSANRSIVFQVSDDMFTSESLTGYITIGLINDNNLVLECTSNPVVYVEGSNPIVIDSNLVLSDLDSDHVINYASLTIVNFQVGDELIAGSNDGLTVDYNEDGVIVISGISTASIYQEILRNVSFLSSADEPLSLQRKVLLTVFQSSINVSCTKLIDIDLINDNQPVVDLTGPSDSTINRTAQIVHNYLTPNQTLIAGENATITDLDADGVVQSLSMELTSNEFGDKLILNPDICIVLTATVCYINVTTQDEAFSCTCEPDYSFASDLVATISLTSISVTTEIATPVSNTLMQLALRKLVLFEHSGVVPGSSYASEIAVVVNDGMFNSQTAISSIQVEYENVGPTVFINEKNLYGEVEMFDGQETVTLAPNVLVADDVGVVSQVIIRITNPVHNMEESLSVTLSGNTNIELIISNDSTYLNLTGMEATSNYTSILKTLQFSYSRMASLLQQQPNVSERIISITAMDADGILGQESTVAIKFSRACSVWLERDSIIDIPSQLTLEELAICTSVSDYHIRIGGESVTSLLPLQDLQSVRSMYLATAPNLKTLEGLENLGYFDELVIDDVSALESLKNLGSNLPDDHRISVVNIAMRNCPALNDISGLRIVENITYIFQVQNCDNLHDMSGLDNIIYAGTLFFIDMSVTTMSSFSRLFQATSIWIYNNNNLESITGFQNLRSLKALNVIFNSELISIDGFSGLRSVELVRMYINPKLCYIGNETATESYWQSIQTQSVVGLFNDCPARSCFDSPYCLNGGSCSGVSSCNCTKSYFGGICQYYDECDSSPCQNNGTCSVDINTNTVQQYTCTCPNGTFGFNCETSSG